MSNVAAEVPDPEDGQSKICPQCLKRTGMRLNNTLVGDEWNCPVCKWHFSVGYMTGFERGISFQSRIAKETCEELPKTSIAPEGISVTTSNFAGEVMFSKVDALGGGMAVKRTSDYLTEASVGKFTKPPVGIMPLNVWNQTRAKDLLSAMMRYVEDGKKAPSVWLIELKGLIEEPTY